MSIGTAVALHFGRYKAVFMTWPACVVAVFTGCIFFCFEEKEKFISGPLQILKKKGHDVIQSAENVLRQVERMDFPTEVLSVVRERFLTNIK